MIRRQYDDRGLNHKEDMSRLYYDDGSARELVANEGSSTKSAEKGEFCHGLTGQIHSHGQREPPLTGGATVTAKYIWGCLLKR